MRALRAEVNLRGPPWPSIFLRVESFSCASAEGDLGSRPLGTLAFIPSDPRSSAFTLSYLRRRPPGPLLKIFLDTHRRLVFLLRSCLPQPKPQPRPPSPAAAAACSTWSAS